MKECFPSLIGVLVVVVLSALFVFGFEAAADRPSYTLSQLLGRFGLLTFIGVLMFVLDRMNPAWDRKG